ncbi:MAG: Rpn family recombination-promoting nuclease/putative transposase [Lachnospiraceae bacterium]|nr:Rpn family recombination-promoting nuclease/putative transposase [Lachnospiraceae bacterium]
MNINSDNSTTATPTTDWHIKTGKLSFRVNNDYLFRALLQSSNHVLKALIASLLHWDISDIKSAEIQNPVELGQTIDSRKYYLDIKVFLNNSRIMNLEMQIINEHNWPERSLSYLCRTFDNLNKGEDYLQVMPAHQIGITEFSPLPESSEFHATYQLLNIRSYEKYTDKFTLSVVDLTQVDKATEEDKKYQMDQWALMFKATTWEDLNMLATQNPAIDEAVTQIYKLTQEEKIRLQMEAREEYYRNERTNQRLLEIANEKLKQATEKLEQANAEKEQAKAEKEQANTRIAELEAKLKAAGLE